LALPSEFSSINNWKKIDERTFYCGDENGDKVINVTVTSLGEAATFDENIHDLSGERTKWTF
jgi:hypothetical protein